MNIVFLFQETPPQYLQYLEVGKLLSELQHDSMENIPFRFVKQILYFFSWLVCERLPKPNVWHLTGSICLKWDFFFIPNLIFTKIVTKILLHYYIVIRIFISIKSRSPSALDSILELLHKSIQTFLRMHIHHGNSILHPVSSCCCWHSN